MRRRSGAPSESLASSLISAICVLVMFALSGSEALAMGPTLAVEDTLPAPLMTLPETTVEADRVTLDEIFRRIVEGEARRDSLMQDQSYRFFAKVLTHSKKGTEAPKVLYDYAAQIYKKRPKLSREITLRSTGEDNVQINEDGDMSEAFFASAFDPKVRGSFHFKILERFFVGGHVIYRIEIRPRSNVDLLPSGQVWVDTNDFVIIREELFYRGKSPAPLWIDSIDSVVLERTLVDDRFWVLSRVVARVKLSTPVRWMAHAAGERVGDYIDMSILQSDWRVNEGIPDSVFAKPQ